MVYVFLTAAVVLFAVSLKLLALGPKVRLAVAALHEAASVITSKELSERQKEAAALCHATQTALFVRRRSEAAGRQLSVREVLMTEESFRRQWPAAPALEDVFHTWVAGCEAARAH